MVRKILPLCILALLSFPALAQTTTTYQVTSPTSGVYSYPYRFFSIPLSNGAEVNWLEVGQNTACANQIYPAVGFIFLTLPGQAESPCAWLTGSPSPNYGTFQGADANGVPFTGSYSLTISTHRSCGSGRAGSCKTVYTITDGEVTVTE